LLLALVVSLAAVAVALLARLDAPLWSWALATAGDFGPWSQSRAIMGTLRALARESLLALPVAACLWLRALTGRGRAALAAGAGAAAILDAMSNLGGLTPSVPRELLYKPPPALQLVPRERPNRTYVVRYPADA